MTLIKRSKDELQQAAIDVYFKRQINGIFYLAPRVGKTRIALKIAEKLGAKKILVLAPRTEIKNSWIEEIQKLELNIEIEFVTFVSMEKFPDWKGDFVVVDEVHELSKRQIKALNLILNNNKAILLTGSMTYKTSEELLTELGTPVLCKYSIEDAIQDGIICDYEIYVHEVDLDNIKSIYTSKAGKGITEKVKFEQLLYVKDKMKEKGQDSFFMDVKLIQILQNSYAKIRKTRELINIYKDERILVFCGATEVADDLNIPSYHSKNKESKRLEDFCNGKGMHLATVKLVQSGITIKPINRGIINYTNGNPESTTQKICRMLTIEYDNPEKKAQIHIVCSTEPFEKERLKTALSFFDKSKIKKL